jgi:hypothetical protein
LVSNSGNGSNPSLHWQSSSESLPGSELALGGHEIDVTAPSKGWYVLAGDTGHNPDVSVICPMPQGQTN